MVIPTVGHHRRARRQELIQKIGMCRPTLLDMAFLDKTLIVQYIRHAATGSSS